MNLIVVWTYLATFLTSFGFMNAVCENEQWPPAYYAWGLIAVSIGSLLGPLMILYMICNDWTSCGWKWCAMPQRRE